MIIVINRYGHAEHPEEFERFVADTDFEQIFVEERQPEVSANRIWQHVIQEEKYFMMSSVSYGKMMERLNGSLGTKLSHVDSQGNLPRVLEILPGEQTPTTAEFFEAIASIRDEGWLSFDTESDEPPHTVQVKTNCLPIDNVYYLQCILWFAFYIDF